MAKTPYEKMFTKRKDGYYQKKVGNKVLYDKDPKALYDKWQASLQPYQPTFSDAAAIYEEHATARVSEKTWKSYRPQYQALVDEFGTRTLESITALDIMSMTDAMRAKDYSKTVIVTKRVIMIAIMQEAVAKGWIKANPVANVPMPKGLKKSSRHAPTHNEIKEICKHTESMFDFLVFFLLCTGLRRGEALALTKSDLDFDRREIRVDKALSYTSDTKPILKGTKSKAGTRIVPMIDALIPPLRKYVRSVKGDLLFPAVKSAHCTGVGYMSESKFKAEMHKYCSRYGVDITAHMLRHGTATLLYEAGVDVYTTKMILGHSSVVTTMSIYTELSDEQKKKSINKLNGMLKGV